MTIAKSRSNLSLVFIVAMVLLALAASAMSSVTVGTTYSHAEVKHLSDAEQVRQACDGSGFYKNWLMSDGKVMQTCFVGNKVGFRVIARINGKWEEITAYFKDSLTGGGRAAIEQWARDYGWKVAK